MPERLLLVRTLVQHDTGKPGGMKLPGDQYSRPASEAGYLASMGVVEFVNALTADDKLAAYGVSLIAADTPVSATPWPPTRDSWEKWDGPWGPSTIANPLA